jgi:hypothetical protein
MAVGRRYSTYIWSRLILLSHFSNFTAYPGHGALDWPGLDQWDPVPMTCLTCLLTYLSRWLREGIPFFPSCLGMLPNTYVSPTSAATQPNKAAGIERFGGYGGDIPLTTRV